MNTKDKGKEPNDPPNIKDDYGKRIKDMLAKRREIGRRVKKGKKKG